MSSIRIIMSRPAAGTAWQVNTEFLTRVEEILTGMGFQPEA